MVNELEMQEPEVLEAVDATYALLEQFDAMILLDAIADHLVATAETESQRFESEVLEHAIKEIRKSRGMDE